MKKTAESLNPPTYLYIPASIKGDTNKLGHFEKDPIGHLKIFEAPDSDKFYYIGVDVGAGARDGDYSVGQVFDHNYNQVAIFRDIIEPDLLAFPIVALAKYYNDARIIPEANAMGLSTISRIIRDLQYGNVYVRKKLNTIDGSYSNEWGFYTSPKTRPTLINTLRQKLSTGELQLYDLDTIHEFLNFVFVLKKNKIRMEASPGSHDDTVLSTGLAIIDVDSIEELNDQRMEEAPYHSIEWYAKKMDSKSDSMSEHFGSVVGM
jgi:hypothetical protein